MSYEGCSTGFRSEDSRLKFKMVVARIRPVAMATPILQPYWPSLISLAIPAETFTPSFISAFLHHHTYEIMSVYTPIHYEVVRSPFMWLLPLQISRLLGVIILDRCCSCTMMLFLLYKSCLQINIHLYHSICPGLLFCLLLQYSYHGFFLHSYRCSTFRETTARIIFNVGTTALLHFATAELEGAESFETFSLNKFKYLIKYLLSQFGYIDFYMLGNKLGEKSNPPISVVPT